MNVYPKYKLRLPFQGEAHVLQLLQDIPDDLSFAIHSLNLPNHEYKRWGEADFVVVSPSGVVVLEVKGGTVTCVERVWRYYNARGEFIESREGPLRQVQSASLAVESILADILGRHIVCRWGVVFPHCRFSAVSPELPSCRLADLEDCRDALSFKAWVEGIPYLPKGRDAHQLGHQEVEEIRQQLVPVFHATQSVGLTIACHHARTLALTQGQIKILDALETNSRLLVQGGAGTGKTELAAAVAQAESLAGYRPVLVCSNEIAVGWMRERLSGRGIEIVTQVSAEGPDFDCLIVDEGQDFCQPGLLRSLFGRLTGGLADGRWRWFMDTNLQFLDNPPSPEALAELRSHSLAVNLKDNVRNTREIIQCIQAFLQADLGLASIDGHGLQVRLRNVSSVSREWEQAIQEIEGLLADGVLATDIAVLGPAGLGGPTCRELSVRIPDVLAPISARNRSDCGVIASLAQFRGLEAACVLLVDLDLLLPGGRLSEAKLYIGMTRAVSYLNLLVSKCLKEWLGELLCRD